jgi:RHS repeat-associated protein
MAISKTLASKRPLRGRFQGKRVCGRAVPAYAINWQPSQAGTYRITAKAIDVGGLEGMSAEGTVTVNESNTAPTITNVSPAINAKYNATNQNLPDPTKPKFEFNLRFPGQYFDSETNLHYNYFRDYSPQTGRYQQSDPIGIDGLLRRAGVLGKGAPGETDSSFSFNPFIDVPDPLLLMIGIVDANQSTGNVVSTNLYAYADGIPLSIADPFGLAPSRGATDS